MNIKQLEYFVDLSQTLNFTKTAQNFYISQTAITKQIQCLEKDLGIPLFIRSKKSVELTNEGNLYLPYARKILDNVALSYQIIEEYQKGNQGSIFIGFIKSLDDERQLDAIITFEYPEVKDYSHLLLQISHLRKYYHQACSLDSLKLIYDVRQESMEQYEIEQTLLKVCLKEGYAILHDFIESNQYSKYLQYQDLDILSPISLYYHEDSTNKILKNILQLIEG